MTSPPKPAARPNIDFGRCFSFVPEDPDWVKKILIGGAFTLFSLVLIGMPFVAGYWARLMKRVAASDPRPLPEWDDLGGIFQEGIRLVGVSFAYLFGVLLLIGLLACPLGLMFGGLGTISRHDASFGQGLAALGGIGLAALYGFLLLAMLGLSLVLPAVAVRVVMTNEFAAGFALREVFFFVRANLGNYLLSIVVYLVAHFVSQFGVLLCCIGIFPVTFWAYLTLAYALGETVRQNPASV